MLGWVLSLFDHLEQCCHEVLSKSSKVLSKSSQIFEKPKISAGSSPDSDSQKGLELGLFCRT